MPTRNPSSNRFLSALAMLICIFSLFLSAYRAVFIHAITLKAKAASWQNRLLMYWPSESAGTITEPRACRALPKQFCIQAGNLFSISPLSLMSLWPQKKPSLKFHNMQRKKKVQPSDGKKRKKINHVRDETRPRMSSFLHIPLLENVSMHCWEAFSPTAHAIASTQTCSRCFWVCVGVRGHWLRAALKEELMRSNAAYQDHAPEACLSFISSRLAKDTWWRVYKETWWRTWYVNSQGFDWGWW